MTRIRTRRRPMPITTETIGQRRMARLRKRASIEGLSLQEAFDQAICRGLAMR